MTLTVYESLEQGSPEWLQARAGIVTASTVGKLLTSTGKVANNDTSRALTQTLAIEGFTGRTEPLHETRDMARGTILEPFARDLYAEHYAPVNEIGFMTREFDEGFRIGYSPDGVVGDDGLIEIKSRTPRIHIATILADKVPAANMAQIQAGLLVSCRAWIDYVSYSPGLALYVKRVLPDPAWHAAIHDAAYQSWIAAGEYRDNYLTATRGMPKTEYFDPFAEEEII